MATPSKTNKRIPTATTTTVEYIPSPSGHSDILRPTILKYGGMCFRKTTGRPDPPLPRYSDGGWATEETMEELMDHRYYILLDMKQDVTMRFSPDMIHHDASIHRAF